jgi:hypothetical protein
MVTDSSLYFTLSEQQSNVSWYSTDFFFLGGGGGGKALLKANIIAQYRYPVNPFLLLDYTLKILPSPMNFRLIYIRVKPLYKAQHTFSFD